MANEMIVIFHHDERGAVRTWSEIGRLVRCKDCKYWHDAPAADGFNSCEMDALIRYEDFFCANGERKDG